MYPHHHYHGGYGYPPAVVYHQPTVQYVQPAYVAPHIVVPAQPVPYYRGVYAYNIPYSRYDAFVMPYNLPPHLQAKVYQASNAFRMFDTNFSGGLSKKEWKRALAYLGFYLPRGQSRMWFYHVDTDRSGRISEREFCEWWLSVHPY